MRIQQRNQTMTILQIYEFVEDKPRTEEDEAPAIIDEKTNTTSE